MMNENKYTRMDIARKSPCQTYNNAARHGTLPDGIVCTTAKKRRRRRSTKQIDLHSAGAHNRIENPKRYKILREQKMKTSELQNNCMVTRIVKGEKIEITPSENFDRELTKRLTNLKKEFELLGKLTGNQYSSTTPKIDYAENLVCELASKAIENLRNPKAIKPQQNAIYNAIKKL
jgi:hypothetical protein